MKTFHRFHTVKKPEVLFRASGFFMPADHSLQENEAIASSYDPVFLGQKYLALGAIKNGRLSIIQAANTLSN
ncbi:hypothetical protein [Buttiauxella brennerae]|uniref:hypothetical protein n=1 Tax=Buttiauxella brennerae TaxID=82988 RepID=UPI00286ED9E5|nr:hypothetical protein [Buttiauxella brennerae]